MTDSELSQYEEFLLHSKDGALNKMIKGTDSYYYFQFIQLLTDDPNIQLTNEQKKQLQEYSKFKTPNATNIKLRNLFFRYDQSRQQNNEEERKKIVEEINTQLFNFNFNHGQPTRVQKVQTSRQFENETNKNHSKLNQEIFDLNNVLKRGLQKLDDFYKIGTKFYSYIDMKSLSEVEDQDIIIQFIANSASQLACFEFASKLISELYSKMKKKNPNYQLDQQIFKNITIKQMEELSTLIPDLKTNSNYIGELYIKKFPYESYDRSLLNQNQKEKEKQINRLKTILQWTQQLPSKFESFSDQILYEILQIGIDTNEYNFDLFVMYLKNPKTTYSRANEQQQRLFSQKNKLYQSQWHNYHGLETQRWSNENDLVNKYLEKYFENNDDYKTFEEFLDVKYLKNLMNQVKLYKGDEIQNITEQFSGNQLKSMNDEKLITICEFNRQWFESDEDVQLYVEIKNIQQLTVKVFEFCSENYYLKNYCEIDSEINLDGLIASWQTEFHYDERPIIKQIKQFTFESIKKKDRGVFIIEFIGNGISSRAIIKKGKLVLKEKITVAGHVFQILDEKLEICYGEKTGIWLDKQFYKASQLNKEIIVPFSQNPKYYQVVIVHNDFASLGNVQIQKETYEFVCKFLYSNESMLMSSKAQILIQPQLLVNGISSTLKLLNDPKVLVTTTTDSGVPSTMTFDKINLNSNQEIEIEFPITAKIQSIDLIVTAKIEKLHGQQDKVQETQQTKVQNLEQRHSIQFNHYTSQRIFCCQFLKYTRDFGYEIYLLGKNGEPKEGIDMDLSFNLDGINQQFQQTLSTDDQGKITLGQLDGVSNFSSNVRNVADLQAEQKQWSLTNGYRVKYQNQITALAGEQITLPFLSKEINNQTVQFIQLSKDKNKNESIIENLQSKIVLDNDQIIIPNLSIGSYRLQLIQPIQQIIEIEIIQGKRWQQNNMIVTEDSLFENTKQSQQLFIKNVNYKEDNDNITISATLKGPNKNTNRVHAIAVQFIQPGSIDELATKLYNNSSKLQQIQINTSKLRNSYLSNKKLSDEQKYVTDRKNKERYIGNTLEKPQILLKRQYIRDTDNSTEQLNQEQDFQTKSYNNPIIPQIARNINNNNNNNNNLYAHPPPPPPGAPFCDQMMDFYSAGSPPPPPQMGGLGGFGKLIPGAYQPPYQNDNSVNTFLNFLQLPAKVQANVKISAAGEFSVYIPKNQYSTVFLIASDNIDTTLEIIPISHSKINTRNLTQKSSLEKNKFYSIFRNNQNIEKDQIIQIEDLTSTELQIIDSIPKIFGLIKELRKCNGHDDEQEGGFDYWSFVQNWDRLTVEEKNKLYDKHQCDELNLFIFFKDRAYFETYIKIYIVNKIEKSFTDYFLLMNRNKLINFSQNQNFQNLNSLEKTLLVIYLVELSEVDQDKIIAKQIHQFTENQHKLQTTDQKIFKQLFDTVLLAKTAEGQQTTEESLNFQFQTFSQQNQQGGLFRNNNIQQSFPMMQPMVQFSNAYNGQGNQDLLEVYNGDQLMDLECEQYYEEEDYDDVVVENKEIDYLKARKQFQSDFKNLEKTKEYGEKHYANTKSLEENKYRVQANGFWLDLIKHSIQDGVLSTPFLSDKFIYCNNNHTEMIAVIALIGLPFETPSHKYTPYHGKGVEITAASPSLIFTKEIKQGKADLKIDILVAQRFYDPQNRYVYSEDDPTVQEEKILTEYIINKVYGCQVIVTNCSITKYDFQVLVEVPTGSIPVETGDYTKSYTITLDPYTTKTIEYFFYFPQPGNFDVYPANVARSGTVVALAKEQSFQVNKELQKSNLETMDEILSKGSKSDILQFVSTKNIQNTKIFNFTDIYYILKDKEFYLDLLKILREKKIFDYTTWTFSFYHADHESLVEFFNSDTIISTGKLSSLHYLKCSLFEISSQRFFEYYPLISQRVHQLSQERSNILNVQFKEQYFKFIRYLVEKQNHTLTDKLVFVYYLLLQERINEAIKIYQSITQNNLSNNQDESILQYDYFSAYLDFYIGFPNFIQARKICEKYLDYPIIHWRNIFYEILNQLTEYDGDDIIQNENKLQNQQETTKINNKMNALNEESLSMEIQGKQIILTHTNVKDVIIQIFKIDLEILFSRNPFLAQENDDFAYVQPNFSFTQILENDTNNMGSLTKSVIDIPEEFTKTNVFIQINSQSKKVQQTYFSTQLQVSISENYGQIKVQDQKGKALSKVYIKTFAKQNNGTVIFYKDGYTDLRGRLDYASLNPDSLKNVVKFSIFIMSDQLGSLIKEVQAPSSTGKYQEEVKLISRGWADKASQQHQETTKSYMNNQMEYGQYKQRKK